MPRCRVSGRPVDFELSVPYYSYKITWLYAVDESYHPLFAVVNNCVRSFHFERNETIERRLRRLRTMDNTDMGGDIDDALYLHVEPARTNPVFAGRGIHLTIVCK